MKDELQDQMARARGLIEATRAKDAELMLDEDKQREQDRAKFKGYVETGLGQDVISAIGPVNFEHKVLQQSMTFKYGSRNLRLQQERGAVARLVVLDETQFSYRQLGPPINLNSQDAPNVFLHALHTAKNGLR
jgi:hypothetical protein